MLICVPSTHTIMCESPRECVVFKWLNKFVVPLCRTYSFPQSVQRALSRISSKKAHMGDRFCLPTFIAIVKETATTDVHFKDSQRSRSLCAFLLIAVNTERGAVRHGWRVCSWQSTHVLSRPCRRRSTCRSASRRRRHFFSCFHGITLTSHPDTIIVSIPLPTTDLGVNE